MNPQQVIQEIIKDIKAVEDQGASLVYTSKLIEHLNQKAKNLPKGPATEAQLEEYRAVTAMQVAKLGWSKDADLEQFRSVITSGQNALRAGMILHGGAALALLTFIGHLVAKPETKPMVAQFAPIMLCFLIGVLNSAVCHGITYVCQFSYHQRWKRFGNTMNTISNLLATAGYVLFAYACYLSYQVFIQM